MNNNSTNYKNMISKIYKTNLKYYAFGRFPNDQAADLLGKTVEYFLRKHESFRNFNYQQLEANMILKIKNLYIDQIRSDNSKSLIGEIVDPGDLEKIDKNKAFLDKGDKLSINEIQQLNKLLKEQNLKTIIYRSSSSTISSDDKDGNSIIDQSIKLNDVDNDKNLKLQYAYDLLNKLGDKCKNLITAQVTRGLKYKEIAIEFDMKIGTVMTNLSRCWAKLKEYKDAK